MLISKNVVCHMLPFVLLLVVLNTGCRDHRAYHDPYYQDDHPISTEQPYYDRWEKETQRAHQDLTKRSQDEQKQYWDWRHRQH